MQASRKQRSAIVETLERRQLLSGGPGHGEGGGAAFVTQTNLVTSGNAGSVPAQFTDPTMINPWGLSSSATSPFWTSDNGSGIATLYSGAGVKQGLVVTIPPATGSTISAPTGQVFAGGDGFVLDKTQPMDAALFIFVGEDGGISGWNPALNKNKAIPVVDNGNADQSQNAVYKGVTTGDVGTSHFLYATNFRAGKVETYDTNFSPVQTPGGFIDRRIPAGFAPFNVQNIGNNLYVTYAKQNDAKHDDVAGPGNGFVDEFNTSGKLIRRFDHGGFLNSPWGVAQAPGTWGRLAGDILVGQFGSGHVDVFSPKGEFRGFLRDGTTSKVVTIDGLWALRFGNGAMAGPTDTLFFTAGTNGENAGLFGSLTLAPRPQGDLDGQDHGDNSDSGHQDQSNSDQHDSKLADQLARDESGR